MESQYTRRVLLSKGHGDYFSRKRIRLTPTLLWRRLRAPQRIDFSVTFDVHLLSVLVLKPLCLRLALTQCCQVMTDTSPTSFHVLGQK